MDIVCIGLNHETAPVAVREKLSLCGQPLTDALHWLQAQESVREGIILSTCNRIEFYLVIRKSAYPGPELIRELFVRAFNAQNIEWDRYLYQYLLPDAVAHLFQVTSGMDSMVIGEPQITGQVKESYRQAVEAGTVGIIFSRLLHRSFAVSKRVRTETELGCRAVSVSYVAVELAKKIFGELSGRTAMLIGAGDMAELAARHLYEHGIMRMLVASRTLENAQRLADSFHGQAIPLDALLRYLAEADIVISSTSASAYVLHAQQIRDALRARKNRPLFAIDMGVPRNIDPLANDLENVFLYDMDDLQKVLATNREHRKRELKKAESLVQEEVREFMRWLGNLDLTPTIVSLREKAEMIRARELEKALSLLRGRLEPEQQRVLEAMSQAIVNKILHDPIAELKRTDSDCDLARLLDSVQRLFSLSDPKGT